ncbi:MAG: hypothetical protein GXO63_02055 [Candidatus Micrarchaeota archaeon]|nr:hypothetical protein [Candidatus Micrarchaeota archaeon]
MKKFIAPILAGTVLILLVFGVQKLLGVGLIISGVLLIVFFPDVLQHRSMTNAGILIGVFIILLGIILVVL